ncbi:MAG: U32 family peptidase [Clostridia bacterium]
MKPELLAPAGNREKMKVAFEYGADAVYLGLTRFSLRDKSENFSPEELFEAVVYSHGINKKVYVTVNIIPKNKDLDDIKVLLQQINEAKPDGIIIADPGVIAYAKKYAKGIDIHVSTQANIINRESAKLFCRLGAKRLILGRELTLNDVREIKKAIGKEHEIEIFVHGAMCVSYSGRCLLSAYMTGRDSNQGDCAQPCRWNYSLMEEKRPGQYYPVYEDENGSYILNSKDLCMIEYIKELIECGSDSFKIEGRMKSSFYVACVVKGYRMALDGFFLDPGIYEANKDEYLRIVSMASHRDYTTAYNLGDEDHIRKTKDSMIYSTSSYVRTHSYVGIVIDYDPVHSLAKIREMNPLFEGDEIQMLVPGESNFRQKAHTMSDENNESIKAANHPEMIYYMKMDRPVRKDTIIITEVKNG